jgi:hypothetical protein
MLSKLKELLHDLISAIKNLFQFHNKPNYKELYLKECMLRKELEDNHRAFCGQMDAVMKESKERYSVYKVKDHNKEF